MVRAWVRPQALAGALRATVCLLGLCFAAPLPLSARIEHKPGFNTFSPQQDVELGQEAAREIEKQVQVVNDPQLTDYISRLGRKLAGYAPGYRYPYTFKVVQGKEINAFALPGGPIYVHTGTILAASSEAQLAGVLAHEISHVALRHSTNQASKAMLAQAPLAILGGIVSGGGLGAQLAQLGIAFGLNSVFLKFSRGAERQADEQGAQILYDAGYDPRAMAQFFQTIERESGSSGVEFLSSHPNPGNREKDITELIPRLGPAKTFSRDDAEFGAIQSRVPQLKSVGQAAPRRSTAERPQPPAQPSRRFRSFQAQGFSIGYPENWQVYGQDTSTLSLVPPEGIIPASEGSLPAVAYGALLSIYEPPGEPGQRWTLQTATEQLVRELQRSNPQLRVAGRSRASRLGGQESLSLTAVGQSPLEGETEVNWIVTTFRPEGLWYIVFIAPERAWNTYQPVFQQMLDAVRFSR